MNILLLILLATLSLPSNAALQEYRKLDDFLRMKEKDFKQLCAQKGIQGIFRSSLTGKLAKLNGYLNDFSTIPADSGYEIVRVGNFYKGRTLYLEMKRLVPLEPKDSLRRYFLEGHQKIRNLPSFLGADGRALFELKVSAADSAEVANTYSGEIALSLSYWIYAEPMKLALIRQWRHRQGKFTDNPDYPDPVEAELAAKFQRFFRYLERFVQ